MYEEVQVSIYQEPCMGGLSLAFWFKRNGKTFLASPIKLEFEEVADGSFFAPTMQWSSELAPRFLKAFSEALDKHGVKTDSDAKIAGTLDATRYHLEDLRDLLKLKKPEERQ